ncbi:MAG: hypothetical protein ABR889_07530, partial [Acidobacteriaceae bacterium]
MQIFRSAPVHLPPWTLGLMPLALLSLGLLPLSQPIAFAAPAKVHIVALGAVRKVPYTPPETE